MIVDSVPQRGEFVFMNNEYWSVSEVVWHADHYVIKIWKSMAAAMMDEE